MSLLGDKITREIMELEARNHSELMRRKMELVAGNRVELMKNKMNLGAGDQSRLMCINEEPNTCNNLVKKRACIDNRFKQGINGLHGIKW